MHTYIYQLTTEKPIKELNIHTLAGGDGHHVDYYTEVVSAGGRENAIAQLVAEELPKGMFTRVDANTLRYNGGLDSWAEARAKEIRELANRINKDNLLEFGGFEFRDLQLTINNLGGCSVGFYTIEEAGNGGTEGYILSTDLMIDIVGQLREGDDLYVGGVLNAHYSGVWA